MASKRDTHRQEVRPLLLAALASPGLSSPGADSLPPGHDDPDLRARMAGPEVSTLADYLIERSALPGPRGNLELAAAFADEVRDACVARGADDSAPAWLLWLLVNQHPPATFGFDPASPLQMPQFCAAVATGEWALAVGRVDVGVRVLQDLANSPLWRIREAVAMGLQRALSGAWAATLACVAQRETDATPYQWRAWVAGVAEPALLAGAERAAAALEVHERALAFFRCASPDARRTEPMRTLRQALGYTISVVVAAAPDPGFERMVAWAAWRDPDVTWMLRENLKKKRLSPWADRCARVRAMLS
jgi:hypothetical protein